MSAEQALEVLREARRESRRFSHLRHRPEWLASHDRAVWDVLDAVDVVLGNEPDRRKPLPWEDHPTG